MEARCIRRRTIIEAQGDSNKRNAVAFLLLLRHKLGGVNYIKDFSIKKVASITGCSWATCEKYIARLLTYGYVSPCATNKSILEIRRLSSGTSWRNIPINGLLFNSLKDARYSLRSLFFYLKLAAQAQVKRSIRCVNNPKTYPSSMKRDDLKKARAFCKKYVKPQADGSYEYREYGFSFSTIAGIMRCCDKTAQNVIKFAQRHLGLKKQRNITYKFAPGVANLPADELHDLGFTYVVNDNFAATVHANSYLLPVSWENKLVNRDLFRSNLTYSQLNAYLSNKEAKTRNYKELYNKGIDLLSKEFNLSKEFLYSFHMRVDGLRKVLVNTPKEQLLCLQREYLQPGTYTR